MIVCAVSLHEVRQMNDELSQGIIGVVYSYKTSKLLIKKIITLLLMFPFSSQIPNKTDSSIEWEFLSDHLERIVYFTQGWGSLGINVSAHAPYQKPLPLQIRDRRYEKGQGHRANGEIVIALNGEFLYFEAEVGVQWQGGQNIGSVVFQIFVDGRKWFDSGVRRELDSPVPVRIYLKGAKELRLVAKDAGDSIICDCANWANARLTPDPSTRKIERRLLKGMDIAPFARVVYSDPQRMDGCRCSRTEEFPPEDIFLEREIAFSPEGYLVPVGANSDGCIGLVWFERRKLRELILEFATPDSIPNPHDIKLQAWLGESHWQGRWIPLSAEVKKENSALHFRIDWQGQPQIALNGTEKVRWIFPPFGKPIIVKRIQAFTNSIPEEGEFILEVEEPKRSKGEVEIYNGEILANGKAVYRLEWNLSKKLHLKLRYFRPSPCKSDRTILWLRLPGFPFGFGIAIEDILENGCVYVEDFGVFATTYPKRVGLDEYKRKIEGRKSVLKLVREMSDQKFSQAMERVHKPIQNNGPTMLSLACDNHKFIVPREGGVLYEAMEVKVKFGTGKSEKLTRYLDGGWFPIPVSQIEENGIVYRQRSFVVPYDGDDETTKNPPYWFNRKPLFVAEIEMMNAGREIKRGEITLSFLANKGNGTPARLEAMEKGIAIFSGEKFSAFLEISSGRIDGNEVKVTWELSPKERKRCFLYIPAWEMKKDELDFLTMSERIELLLAETRRYWERVLSDTLRIDIPEPLLANLIKASQVHCLIAARNEEGGERIAPWISSMSYGSLESEAHSIIYGMDLFGHSEFAKKGLEFFISRYNERGYLTTGYTIVGTGWHLWTLARHCRLTRDNEWLKKHAKEIARVCDWIVHQREKTKVTNYKGEKVPEYGLMPPGVAADWNRFAYRFFNQAHYYAGLAEVAEVLSEVGYPEAEAYRKEAREFKEDIVRAYHWNQSRMPALRLSNGKWIPAYPGMLYCFGRVGEMYPGEDWNRSWAGDVELGAHHLIPCGVLEANSRDADWIVGHMEDYWFLQSGMGEYPEEENRKDWFNLGGFSKIQPYYTRIVEIYAQRDEIKPFIRSYFNAIPSLLNEENLSFWEHFHNIGAWNKTHETGWFLVQTRNMFVVERGKELWLAPFLPSYWMEDGKRVKVSRALTFFGEIGYSIHSFAGSGCIEAEVEVKFSGDRTPEKLVLRLRHPKGKKMKKVLVDGEEHKEFDGARECVFLKPKDGKIHIRACY